MIEKRETQNRDFPKETMGDNNAKENFHRNNRFANCCINRAGRGCLRTSPRASEESCDGNRAIAEQQCLCRTPGYRSAILLVELRRRRDGVGNGWSLICGISKKGSGIAGAFLEADQMDLGRMLQPVTANATMDDCQNRICG
jgi:hypothetical protein